jgi:hypothetical protein
MKEKKTTVRRLQKTAQRTKTTRKIIVDLRKLESLKSLKRDLLWTSNLMRKSIAF